MKRYIIVCSAAAAAVVLIVSCYCCAQSKNGGSEVSSGSSAADSTLPGSSHEQDSSSNQGSQSDTAMGSSGGSSEKKPGSGGSLNKESAVSRPPLSSNQSSQTSSTYNGDRKKMTDLCNSIINSELPRLKSTQLSNGAIPMYNIKGGGKSRMNPYFACSAALGLLEAGEHEAVKKYINWHFSHLETRDVNGLSGTIYDYEITVLGGSISETPLNDYDSTDSYAALFLILLDEYAAKTGDKAPVLDQRAKVDKVLGAMEATLSGSLTYAKPTYKVQYLMDNCEVYAGFLSAARLYENIYGDAAKAAHCKSRAALIKNGIESLWRASSGTYDWAKGSASDTAKFYADGSAQLFPVMFGAIAPDSQRAKQIYADFKKHHKAWIKGTNSGDYPWTILLRTVLAHGDYDTAYEYLSNVNALYAGGGDYRWYSQEQGVAVWAAIKLKNALS